MTDSRQWLKRSKKLAQRHHWISHLQCVSAVIVSILGLMPPCTGQASAGQPIVSNDKSLAVDIDSLLKTRIDFLESFASKNDTNATVQSCLDWTLSLREAGHPDVYWRYLLRQIVLSEVFLSMDCEVYDYHSSLFVLFRSDSNLYLAGLTSTIAVDSLNGPRALRDSIVMRLQPLKPDTVVVFLRRLDETYHLTDQPPFRDCKHPIIPGRNALIAFHYGGRSSLLFWCRIPNFRKGVNLRGLITFFDDALGSSCPPKTDGARQN